jgi:ribosomal protein RSM22 (predicted rRNA methylase)
MRLPAALLDALERETARVERRKLAHATAQLTESYKAASFSAPVIATEAQRAAYLAVRLPATYAAARRVFAELRQRAPQAPQGTQVKIGSMLDLGAGPATALFAAVEEFPQLQQATLLESDPAWIALGKRLAAESALPAVREAQWVHADLRSGFSCEPHDLVMISYALGELPQSAAEAVLRKAWSCARKFLAIVEPGTRRGFSTINAARSSLIAATAASTVIAPCPHLDACPMATAGDWCHFSQRVERTSQHRQLKGGALGYEDEKFSYLIAGKGEVLPTAGARIVRHPGKHSGHVQLVLCTPQGQIETRTVTRSAKDAYKLARRAEWGDVWAD